MEQKIRFVRAYQTRVATKEISMTSLCAEFGISRKTGYKMLARRDENGWPGLEERTRAPHGGEQWAPPETILSVLDVRQEFPEWGSRKIVAYLEDIEPEVQWPSASTAHEWIRRAGMVEPQSRRRRFSHPGPPPAVLLDRPNQQWSVDFKGHFRTLDRRYCYPLTVADSFSRYLIGCDSLLSTSFELVQPVFVRLFREYGLPEMILSDNGTPFSSNSVRRLSALSVWWMRLGIRPRLTQPGKPQQNGRHERMHRALKADACRKPAGNATEQQKPFDRFVYRYNFLRPHEALNQKPPHRSYAPSPRPFPTRLPNLEYPSSHHARRVRSSGEIKWAGQWFFVSEALVGQTVAFEVVGDGCSILRFGDLELGFYSERDKRLYLDRVRPEGKTENQ